MSKPVVTAKVTKESINKMINDLSRWAVARRARVGSTTASSLLNIQRNAKRNARSVDLGRLRAAINIERNPDGMGGGVVVPVDYAPYVEFGTGSRVFDTMQYNFTQEEREYAMQFFVSGRGRMPPQPYLFPAAEEERPQYINNIIEILNK